MEKPQPSVEFHRFGEAPLVKLLGLERTHGLSLPEQPKDPFRQLAYIEKYLSDQEIACRSVLVERYYIDRDHMEDHSVFYSRSLHAYENWCQRVHFFSEEPDFVESELARLLQVGRARFESECSNFSKKYYCGFSVIKPLSGSPVGRTVLLPYGPTKSDSSLRDFPCVRPYKAHVLGVELTVHGLGFQQQDLGVSACATTAIWSSLQQFRAFEDIGTAMPAQITKLASQHALPFGRSMPSEGLSVDQMCMAIEGLGMAPSLLRASQFETARSYIYSATRSGFTPVLILKMKEAPPLCHAVAVVGLNVRTQRPFGSFIGNVQAGTDDQSVKLIGLYVHDDRNGPYLRANIKMGPKNQLLLTTDVMRDGRFVEEWELTHVLIPSYSKIRLSFSGLRTVALGLSQAVNAFRQVALQLSGPEASTEDDRNAGAVPDLTVVFETWIQRCHSYNEDLIFNENGVENETIKRFLTTLHLPRYLGVIRLSAPFFGIIDVLVDTTSTLSNLHFVGIVRRGRMAVHTVAIAKHLSHEGRTPFVI